jgi:flagellar protein FliO/FliZ
MNGLLLQTLGSLALVVILIFVILFILKKYVYRDYGHGKSSAYLKILGHLVIQPKKFIYIIKIFDKILIIGVSENNINVLSEINDSESVQKIEGLLTVKTTGSRNFLDYLKSNIGIK